MESSDALMARFLALHPRTIDLSLGRIERLLAALGHPERRLPPVIHVAGTNGKGSTIATMRAILEAGGLSAHVYTSPHLVRFHERIRLGAVGGGRFVPEDRLAEAFARCEAVNAGAPITVFEITTAAALLLFSEAPADVLLLEVGLGGRVDATNVIDRPACAVVTPIGRDHAEYLGDTVEAVAGEKAGIFKRGCPAVIAPQDYAQADAVLCARAEAVGATPILVGNQDFSAHEERGRLVYQDEDGLLDLPRPKLAGRHQIVNAGTAIAALRAAGFGDIGTEAFEAGLSAVEWPGGSSACARAVSPACCRRARSSGSTAATTSMAGASSPPRWPTCRSGATRPWSSSRRCSAPRTRKGSWPISAGSPASWWRCPSPARWRRGRPRRWRRSPAGPASRPRRPRASRRRSPRSATGPGSARPGC